MASALRIQEYVDTDLLRYLKLQVVNSDGLMSDLPESIPVCWNAELLNGGLPTSLNVGNVATFSKRYLTTPDKTIHTGYTGYLNPLGYAELLTQPANSAYNLPLTNLGIYVSSDYGTYFKNVLYDPLDNNNQFYTLTSTGSAFNEPDWYQTSGYIFPDTGYWSVSYNLSSSCINNGLEIEIGTWWPITGVQIVGSWSANYGTYTWGVCGAALTAAMLSATMLDYNDSYIITGYVPHEDCTPITYVLAPREIAVNEADRFTNYVDLCATYYIQNYNYRIPSGSMIRWKVSDPIKAIGSDDVEITINDFIDVYSITGTYLRFLTAGPCHEYEISAFINGESVKINSYDFSYDPFVSETLSIEALSSTKTKRILKLNRLVYGECNTYNGTFAIEPSASITWYFEPSTANTIGYVGLSSTYDNVYDIMGNNQSIDIPVIGGREFSSDGWTGYGLSGQTGIINTLPLTGTYNSGITAVTAYYNDFGIDVIQINMDPTLNTTYKLTAFYNEYPTISTTYSFYPIFYTTDLSLSSTIALDNQPYIRTITLKAYNENSTDIDEVDYLIWNVSGRDINPLPNIWATYTDGVAYTFNSPTNASISDTLNFFITTERSDTPQICSFSILASAITGYNTPTSGIFTANYNIIVDEYPLTFEAHFKINNENPLDVNNAMYRELINPYNLIATDLTTPSATLAYNNYNRTWFWNNNISVVQTQHDAHTYTVAAATSFRINFMVDNVSASNWISAHSISATEYMDLVFVDSFLSGYFIAYPTQVFDTSATYIVLNDNNYTSTQGVCAYGEGHSEFINISASELNGNTYRWTIGGIQKLGNRVDSIEIPSIAGATFDTAGSGIYLDVFNGQLPITMSQTHTADNGVVEYYPNFSYYWHTTAVSSQNLLYQNARMVPYETPICEVSSSYIILQRDYGITLHKNLTWPSHSPVSLYEGGNTYIWTVSTNKWLETYSSTNDAADTSITLHDGTNAYGIQKYVTNMITFNLSSNVGCIIDYPAVKGLAWERSTKQTTSNTYEISAYVLPNINIYLDNQYVLTGERIEFENGTSPLPTGLISAFIWDNGYGLISSIEGFSSYVIPNGYTEAGTYSVSISVVTFDSYMYTQTFPDIVTVVGSYITFDEDITRVAGETVLALPYKEQDILIPPNEWVTNNNINMAFDRLNSNLTYLKNSTKAYNSPPTTCYGWLGYTSAYDMTNILQWHLEANSENINTLDVVTDQLSAVNDIVVKNNIMYMVNGSHIELRSMDMFATLLATRWTKTINDYFGELKSIAVDSNNRIYVLDKPKNRVCVFEYNDANAEPWRFIYSWGGLGGASAKSKFQQPNDLIADANDNIWIVDSGNLAIKEYTRTGSWIQTITSPLFTPTNPPISIAIDQDRNLHILTQLYVVKMNNSGTVLSTYDYTNPSADARKIIACVDDGFVYICTKTNVIKVSLEGNKAGSFGDELTGDLNYKSVYRDIQRNLYIANNNVIIKYYDKIDMLETALDITQYDWDMEDIYIEAGEYVQDWVYNRSLSRMWDNLELFRKSIIGKFEVSGDRFEVKGLGPVEYMDALSRIYKDNIYVGVNEFVTADVVNRCLKSLYNMQAKLLNLIN